MSNKAGFEVGDKLNQILRVFAYIVRSSRIHCFPSLGFQNKFSLRSTLKVFGYQNAKIFRQMQLVKHGNCNFQQRSRHFW